MVRAHLYPVPLLDQRHHARVLLGNGLDRRIVIWVGQWLDAVKLQGVGVCWG